MTITARKCQVMAVPITCERWEGDFIGIRAMPVRMYGMNFLLGKFIFFDIILYIKEDDVR